MKKLDLHRTRHEDVRQKVIKFIERNWNSDEELKIITGHSPQMKNLVIKVLNEYQMNYSIGDMANLNTGFIHTTPP